MSVQGQTPVAGVLFRFAQAEFPWALGPPDGRYLIRAGDSADPHPSDPTHVIVFATLGAPQRRRLAARGRAREGQTEATQNPVDTRQANMVD
ncbi:MAG: hypothetical protein ACR2NR_20145, partial [Solirubrobacteraceae bacterium]